MQVDVESDDEDPVLEILHNSRCNRKYTRQGFKKICFDGITPLSLQTNGWRYTPTSGRNSSIYMKKGRVLKISKHARGERRTVHTFPPAYRK